MQRDNTWYAVARCHFKGTLPFRARDLFCIAVSLPGPICSFTFPSLSTVILYCTPCEHVLLRFLDLSYRSIMDGFCDVFTSRTDFLFLLIGQDAAGIRGPQCYAGPFSVHFPFPGACFLDILLRGANS